MFITSKIPEEIAVPAAPLTTAEPTLFEPRCVGAADRARFYERFAKDVRQPRSGSPLTDEHLSQVTELYRAAVEREDPPTQTVAQTMNVTRPTAARWVAEARKRKLLGPAKRGRGGEAD